MTRYRLDTLKGRVIAFECKNAEDYDDAHAKQYENTHFDTHDQALVELVSSLRYQVLNASQRYREAARTKRKARRALARVTALFERLGGLKP